MATRIAACLNGQLGVEMDDKKGPDAMLQWRATFLGEGVLQEGDYDQALMAAARLEQSGAVCAGEWLQMVRQANAALLYQS